MNKIFGPAVVVATLASAPAFANIMFVDNPGNLCMLAGLGGGCEQNIMFEQQSTIKALTITGDTDKTNSPVIFDTTFLKGMGSNGGAGTGQLIAADGIGQANIICEPGATACVDNHLVMTGFDAQLSSLEMKPGGNTAWGDALINLDSGVGGANIFVTDNMGHNFNDPLGPGQNFLGIIASAGEEITDIQVTQIGPGPFGWNDFKQPRVSGVCTLTSATQCTPIPIPEPSSLALMGGALVMLGFSIRRRQRRWL